MSDTEHLRGELFQKSEVRRLEIRMTSLRHFHCILRLKKLKEFVTSLNWYEDEAKGIEASSIEENEIDLVIKETHSCEDSSVQKNSQGDSDVVKEEEKMLYDTKSIRNTGIRK